MTDEPSASGSAPAPVPGPEHEHGPSPEGAEQGRESAQPPPPPPPAELAPALARFERGDFRGARAEIRALLATTPAPELEAAARTLEARMAPDRWALRIGLAAAAVLALLVWLYVV